jgi:glutathione S-transferase
MLVLRSSPPSPFCRKILVGTAILGMADRLQVVAADTNEPNDSLRRQNPLGKIPTLILEDGTALYDSAVILEYLDLLAGGGKIIPQDPARRFNVLTRQALADGLAEASVLQIYETRFRDPDRYSAKWLDHQSGKAARAVAALEASPPAEGDADVGAISTACALGYLDLRFSGGWRTNHPRLVRWLDAFSARVPAFAATRVEPS